MQEEEEEEEEKEEKGKEEFWPVKQPDRSWQSLSSRPVLSICVKQIVSDLHTDRQ